MANVVENVELLPAVCDEYGGIIVEMKEPMNPSVFHSMLISSMEQWKLQGKKGVWMKLPIGLVNLVEMAVKEGFWYHHAEPEYLMLVYWIPKTYNTLPINATHRVRIGAVVMNDKREILVVQEKIGRFHGTGIWKIPTGALDEGEDIFRAATREVKEETGVDTEFMEILGFRQLHKSFFQKSDMLFLCMLRPLSHDIQKQDSEIDAARWIPFDEYAAQPVSQKHDLFRHMNDVCLATLEKRYTGFTPLAIKSYFGDPLSYLYLNKHGLKSQNGIAHI
ncbi:hypothetical protein Leryth_007847 [Lithospermum erythrorhizon]|nr:hypothetical protein Leryth_007847 [Lithospermum erythrorhizon]